MNKPRNQREEVLYTLLNEANITHRTMPFVMNLTSVITKLRNAGVIITCRDRPHVNKFGRKITYGEWSIPWWARDEARDIYERMTKEVEVERIPDTIEECYGIGSEVTI